MFGPEVVWVNNFGLVRAVSALYALSTLSVLREAAGAQLSRYRSAARVSVCVKLHLQNIEQSQL